MKDNYFKTIVMIEHLHRLSLQVVKSELNKMKISDINNIQCFILYHLGMQEIIIADMINRGYYLGKNVSYNLKNMIKNGYVVKETKYNDNRSRSVKLSTKGIKLHKKLENLFIMQSKDFYSKCMNKEDLDKFDNMLFKIENFFLDNIKGQRASLFLGFDH